MTRFPEAVISVSTPRPLDTLVRVALEARRRHRLRVVTLSFRTVPSVGGSEIELRVRAGQQDIELLCARLRRLVDVRAVTAVTAVPR